MSHCHHDGDAVVHGFAALVVLVIVVIAIVTGHWEILEALADAGHHCCH